MSLFIYKLLTASLIILTPIFSFVVCKVLRLKKLGIIFPDLTVVLYILEILFFTSQFFDHNFLYYYLTVISLLSIVVAIWQYIKHKSFTYKRWFKIFWRLNFFITFFFFLATLAIIFYLP